MEYEYALEKSKPLFAVVINERALEEKVKAIGSSVLEQENPKELKEFRSQVLKNLCRFWDDKKDIKIAIHETISDFYFKKDLIGWIRGNNSVNTGLLAEEIARLTNENSELRSRLINEGGDVIHSGLTYFELKKILENRKTELYGMENLFKYFLFLA